MKPQNLNLIHMTIENYREIFFYSFAFVNFNLEKTGSISVASFKHSELSRKQRKSIQKRCSHRWQKHKIWNGEIKFPNKKWSLSYGGDLPGLEKLDMFEKASVMRWWALNDYKTNFFPLIIYTQVCNTFILYASSMSKIAANLLQWF